jgi:hypothetical protein
MPTGTSNSAFKLLAFFLFTKNVCLCTCLKGITVKFSIQLTDTMYSFASIWTSCVIESFHIKTISTPGKLAVM